MKIFILSVTRGAKESDVTLFRSYSDAIEAATAILELYRPHFEGGIYQSVDANSYRAEVRWRVCHDFVSDLKINVQEQEVL